MSNEAKQEAATHAKRAARQSRNAAKNGIRTVNDVAEVAADEVHDAAQGVADKVHDAAQGAVKTATKPDPRVVIAGAALFLGGTYLAGRLLGYRQAQRVIGVDTVVDSVVVD